jgi:hypothetical protein
VKANGKGSSGMQQFFQPTVPSKTQRRKPRKILALVNPKLASRKGDDSNA